MLYFLLFFLTLEINVTLDKNFQNPNSSVNSFQSSAQAMTGQALLPRVLYIFKIREMLCYAHSVL